MEKYKNDSNLRALTHAGLTTYIRLDEELFEMIKESLGVTYAVDGHRLAVKINTPFENMEEWSKVNPGALVNVKVNAKGYVDATATWPSTILGLSLSNTPVEILRKLAKIGFIRVIRSPRIMDGWTTTKNNAVFNDPKSPGYIFAVLPEELPQPVEFKSDQINAVKSELTDLDKKYIDLWKGHDAYYAFSDDSGVYKRGKENHNRLEEEGCKMGLTQLRMNHLFRVYIGPVQR